MCSMVSRWLLKFLPVLIVSVIISLALLHFHNRPLLLKAITAQTLISPQIVPFRCVETEPYYRNLTYTICLKTPHEDKYISNHYYRYGIYERSMINLILASLYSYPTATFIDLGANIGAYTIPAAKLGHKVIAVDPVARNIAFIKKSLAFQKRRPQVQFLRNFVSDVNEKSVAWNVNSVNGGDVSVISEEEASTKLRGDKEIVTSVTFSQILSIVNTTEAILKVDVQGYECKVLHNYLVRKVKPVYIPFIIIEWSEISVMSEKNDETLCPQFQEFVEGFINSGYSAYDPKWVSPANLTEFVYKNLFFVHEKAEREPVMSLLREVQEKFSKYSTGTLGDEEIFELTPT